jgi:hypothetical protein
VVDVGLNEARVTFLIARSDGSTTAIAAWPVVSPDSRYAVAYNSSLMDGPDLELVDLQTIPPSVMLVTTRPACAGKPGSSFLRRDPVWIDTQRVRFEGESPISAEPGGKEVLKIVDGMPEWEC